MMIEKGVILSVKSAVQENIGDDPYRKLIQTAEMLKNKKSKLWLCGSITEFSASGLLSSYAIDESLISEDWLKQAGFMIAADSDQSVLRQAYQAFRPDVNYMVFSFQDWVRNEAIYHAFMKQQGNSSWRAWPDSFKYQPEQQDVDLKPYQEDLLYRAFVQQELFLEWKAVKQKANDLDLKVIGTLPYLPCIDSVDVWSHQDCFKEDGDYNWQVLKQTEYHYWMDRIGYSTRIYDGIILEDFSKLAEHGKEPFFIALQQTSDELNLYVRDTEPLSDQAKLMIEKYHLSILHGDVID